MNEPYKLDLIDHALQLKLNMEPTPESKLEKQFWAFHKAHPYVYDHLVKFAMQWRDRNRSKRCGIAMLYERARWELSMGAWAGAGYTYKLNNNHKAFYARMMMKDYPDLRNIFSTRKQKHESTLGE